MSTDDRRRPRVAVVGGGISGLAAAWRLRAVADVVVLEQADVTGGKLRLGVVGEHVVDVGAEAFLFRRPQARGLAEEVGLTADLVHPATTAANVAFEGRLVALPSRTFMGVPADPASLAGLLDASETARVAAEADLPAVDCGQDVDVATWVGERLGQAVVDRLVEPLLGGVYAGHPATLSARTTLGPLWEASRRHGSLLAAAAALTPAASPAPSPAPSPGAVPTPAPMFGGIRGGVGRLPAAVADALIAAGAQVRTGVTVRALTRTTDGWRLTLGPVPAPEYLDVDAVVLAVPAAPAARLLAQAAPTAAAELAAVETASVAVVACLVPRSALAGLPGSGVLVPSSTGHPVKAMTFSAAKWAWIDALDADHVLLRASLGRHREEQVLQRDDDDLVALALADVEGLLGRRVVPVASHVQRWGGALPQPAVGHADRVARILADVAARPGLALCGALVDGVGIPACIGAAGRAADQVSAYLAARASTARETMAG